MSAANSTQSAMSVGRSTLGTTSQHRSVQVPISERAHTPQSQYQSSTTPYYQPSSHMQQPSQPQSQAQLLTQTQPRYGEINNALPSARTNRASTDSTNTRHSVPDTVTATINPTQVYDPYHDWQRQALRAEAEAKQRALDREREAALRAQQEKQREASVQSVQATVPDSTAATNITPAASESIATTTDAPVKKRAPRKSDGTAPKKSHKKKQTEDAPKDKRDDSAQAAAMTLLQAANGEGSGSSTSTRPETELEKQMREMFKKMREFNTMNPDMLSRLWQEERDAHLAGRARSETNIASESAQPQDTPTSISTQSKPKKAKAGGDTSVTKTGSKKKKDVVKPDQTNKVAAQQTPVIQSSASQQNHMAPQASSLQQAQTQAPTTQTTPGNASATSKGTIWPADKKASLAAAAAEILVTSNPGKVVSSKDISAMLDQNPSYVELCEQLQGKGFVVDRSKFAKALLSAVPDINRPTPKSNTTAGSSQAAAGGGAPTAPRQTNASLVKNAEARLMQGESIVGIPKVGSPKQKASHKRETTTPAQPSPSITTPASSTIPASAEGISGAINLEGFDALKSFVEKGPTGNASTGTGKIKASKSNGKHRPSIQPAPLPTKEGQARKRTFADLVDLTALSSEDEEIASMQQAKRQEVELEAPIPPMGDDDEPVQLPTPPNTVENVPVIPVVRGPRPPESQPAAARPAAPISTQLVQPHVATVATVSQSSSALVARLTQTQLLSQRPVVQQPVLPHSQPVLPRTHQSSVRMVQPLDRYKAIRRSSYNPKTIARDVLLACGRHPDMRHLNAHLEILKQVFKEIDNNADLGTLRWDIADPGGPAPGSGAEVPKADMYNDADDEGDSDDDSVVGGGGGQRVAVRQTIGADGTTQFEVIGSQNPVRSKSAAARFPGRPRRSDGVHQAAGTPRQAAGPAPGGATPSGSGYAALRAQLGPQVDENGQPIKKKGRPVGWRKWMMKDGGNYGSSPASGPSGTKKALKPTSPEPEYQVYKCEWKDCGAELHNLATLRKHLYKLHGKPDTALQYKCMWSDCGKVVEEVNGRITTRITRPSFWFEDGWKQHVGKAHLEPIAWRLGDGPTSGVSEPSEALLSEAYLSDAQGRRVTPRVVIPVQQASAAAHPPRSSAHEKALEVERQAIKRKRDIGVGIDKGGASLATDKRRQGFIDNDDTAMVVDDDE